MQRIILIASILKCNPNWLAGAEGVDSGISEDRIMDNMSGSNTLNNGTEQKTLLYNKLVKYAIAQADRMVEILKGDDIRDVAHFLGLEPIVIEHAIMQGHIPDSWVDKLATCFNVSKNWIIYGRSNPGSPEKPPPKTAPAPPPMAPLLPQVPPPQEKKPNDRNKIIE